MCVDVQLDIIKFAMLCQKRQCQTIRELQYHYY